MKKLTSTCTKAYAGFVPSPDHDGYLQVFTTNDYDDAVKWATEFYTNNPRVFIQEVITITNYLKIKLL